jgi:AcrR family transcriptional regulator
MTGSDGNASRQRLLDAARHVLARDGLEALSLRAIAREAGVSHGAPLRHFSSLSSLLASVSAGGFRQLIGSVDATVGQRPRPSDARRRLDRAAHGYVRFALAAPGVYSVMFRPELSDVTDPDYQAAAAASFQQLVDLVQAAQHAGLHSGVETRRLAAILWAEIHGLTELWLHGGLQSVVGADSLEDVVDTYLRLRR